MVAGAIGTLSARSASTPNNRPSTVHISACSPRDALGGLFFAVASCRRLVEKYGGLNASLVGAGVFVAIIVVAQLVLPDINEVPVTLPVSQESLQNYGDSVAVRARASSAADMALTVAAVS